MVTRSTRYIKILSDRSFYMLSTMMNKNRLREQTLLKTSDGKTNVLLIVLHDFTDFWHFLVL